MRVLVDTHVFLWWAEGDRRRPAKASAALRDPDNECLFSLASVWEIAIKAGLGKLKLAVVTADPLFTKYGVKRIW